MTHKERMKMFFQKYVTRKNKLKNVHSEDFCQKCKNPNPAWSAPNEIWNEVMSGEGGIICPKCFQDIADQKGINVFITAKLL